MSVDASSHPLGAVLTTSTINITINYCQLCLLEYKHEGTQRPWVICQNGHSICQHCVNSIGTSCPFDRQATLEKPILNRALIESLPINLKDSCSVVSSDELILHRFLLDFRGIFDEIQAISNESSHHPELSLNSQSLGYIFQTYGVNENNLTDVLFMDLISSPGFAQVIRSHPSLLCQIFHELGMSQRLDDLLYIGQIARCWREGFQIQIDERHLHRWSDYFSIATQRRLVRQTLRSFREGKKGILSNLRDLNLQTDFEDCVKKFYLRIMNA